MNCKPGDLAIVVRDGPYIGTLVAVLYAAPAHSFSLPDGHGHMACEADEWVVELLGRKLRAPCEHGSRMTRYCSARDSSLRPLRGVPETERVEDEITA